MRSLLAQHDTRVVIAELEAHLSDPFCLETTAYMTMEKAALYVATCCLHLAPCCCFVGASLA